MLEQGFLRVGQKPILQSTGTALHNILTLLVVMKQETSLNCIYIFLDFYLFCNYFYLIFDVQSKIQNNSYWKCNKLLLVLN